MTSHKHSFWQYVEDMTWLEQHWSERLKKLKKQKKELMT